MANYRELDIWEDSCQLAKSVYELARNLKVFGLKDQITRSAVSIPSNIAEGAEKESDSDFVRYLRIAKGSCAECRTQARIAHLTGQFSFSDFQKRDSEAESINNRIGSLIRYLKSPNAKGHRP